MANKILTQFISDARSRGVSDDRLRKSLLERGWKATDIDDAFSEIKSSRPPKAPSKPKLIKVRSVFIIIAILVIIEVSTIFFFAGKMTANAGITNAKGNIRLAADEETSLDIGGGNYVHVKMNGIENGKAVLTVTGLMNMSSGEIASGGSTTQDETGNGEYLFTDSEINSSGLDSSKFGRVAMNIPAGTGTILSFNQESEQYSIKIFHVHSEFVSSVYNSVLGMYRATNYALVSSNEYGEKSARLRSPPSSSENTVLIIKKGSHGIGFIYNSQYEDSINKLARIATGSA